MGRQPYAPTSLVLGRILSAHWIRGWIDFCEGNTLCLPGVKPGILWSCLESNPVYSMLSWNQTRNTLCLPGVKPGILCAFLESNPEYSVSAWSQTRYTLCLPGVKPRILFVCLESNPVYFVSAWSQTQYTLLAGSQTRYTLLAWRQIRYTLCLPLFKPSLPVFQTPGIVTVLSELPVPLLCIWIWTVKISVPFSLVQGRRWSYSVGQNQAVHKHSHAVCDTPRGEVRREWTR